MAPTIFSEKKRRLRSLAHRDNNHLGNPLYNNLSTSDSSSVASYVNKPSINERRAATIRIRLRQAKALKNSQVTDPDKLTQHSSILPTFGTETSENCSTMPTDLSKRKSPTSSLSRPSTPSSTISSMSSYASTDVEDGSRASESRAHGNRTPETASNLTVFNHLLISDKQMQLGANRILHRHINDPETCRTYTDICDIKNAKGLLAIALKTIKLVQRNQMLQQRLAQLQMETSEFIQSVMENPENRHFRNKITVDQ